MSSHMTSSFTTADQIVDRVHMHVRKHLAVCKGRTRSELELLFADLRNEIARILQEAGCSEDDDDVSEL